MQSTSDTMPTDSDNVRLNITISRYDFRKLKNWAKIHGKTPTAFAGQIVASILEANFDNIFRQMEDIARYEGINVTELEKQWEKEDE